MFDNLPHDRLYGDIRISENLKETWVDRDNEGKLFEIKEPLSDPLIKETLAYYKQYLE